MKNIKCNAIILILLFAVFLMVSCGDDVVGFWTVDEIRIGDVVMDQEDASTLGYKRIGSFRLQKSGNCEVTLLDEECTGTWTQDEKNTIHLKYDEETTAEATIDEDGIMTLTDSDDVVMKLSK
jgi:hypothetical protein